MRTSKRITLLLITLLTFSPLNASAQDDTEDSDNSLAEALSEMALFIVFIGAGYAITSTTTTAAPMISITISRDSQASLDHYINAHHHQIEQDIALGAGNTLNDLAQLYDIPSEHYRDFSLAIRKHRRQLTILDPQDPAQTEQFGQTILTIKHQLLGLPATTQHQAAAQRLQ